VNDTDQDAKDLIKLSRRIPSFINLIEFNKVDKVPYEKSSPDRIRQFASLLIAGGVNAKIRMSRGEDIDAACGQLANKLK
jgi:23S rRNA (adenine2503-C2)-methyltransferase